MAFFMIKPKKAKKCKGTGQATNSGCGKETLRRIYGLCEPCYYDWLLNTEAGRIKLEKSTLKGKIRYRKDLEEEKKAERSELKKKKEELKTHSEWLADCQVIFNRFVRLRDVDLPCISCGEFRDHYDAGHFRSVGGFPELRLDENNAHKQCVYCNQHRGGNLIDYRLNLIKKIGNEEVERLEGYNPPLKLSIPEIKEKIKQYKQKIKELTKIHG
jgi:hypothetical protein